MREKRAYISKILLIGEQKADGQRPKLPSGLYSESFKRKRRGKGKNYEQGVQDHGLCVLISYDISFHDLLNLIYFSLGVILSKDFITGVRRSLCLQA